jgi:hypothetical protein
MRRPSVTTVVVLPLALSGCPGAMVLKAADAFHSGHTSTANTLANRQAALVSAARTEQVYDKLVVLHPLPSAKETDAFAAYACARPTGLNGVVTGMQVVNAADSVVGKASTAPTQDIPSLTKGLIADFGNTPAVAPPAPQQTGSELQRCQKTISRYVALNPKTLPSLNEPPPPLTAAFPLPTVVAALALVQAGISGVTIVLSAAEQEARADQLKRFVLASDNTVQAAFKQIDASNPRSVQTFCAITDNDILCESDPTTDVTKSRDAAEAPKRTPNILDGITIRERWAALWHAWLRYQDYVNMPPTRASAGFADMEAQRRQALDQAIQDYMNIPNAGDIVAADRKAWNQLLAMAKGDLTADEAFGALSAFADNAQSILNAAQKVSDAKDTFDKALKPSGP